MTAAIVLVAFFATILGSISGIGGGVIIKPVMDAVVDMPAASISFLSGTTVLTMTIVSLLRSRKGSVKVDSRGTSLAVGAAVGGLLGKMIFSHLVSRAANQASVSLIQNILMVILTASVFFYTLFKEKIAKKNVQNAAATVAAGLLLGLASSFLGIGGGPINIMVLSYFFSMDTKTAALTSLYIIFFSQIVSFVLSAVEGFPPFDPVLLILMMVAAVVGATVGRSLSRKMTGRGVDVLFMCMLVGITGISISNVVRFAGAL